MRKIRLLLAAGLIPLLAAACQTLPYPTVLQNTTQTVAYIVRSPADVSPPPVDLNISLPWKHLSTTTGDLPMPGPAVQQTASLVLDVNGDGLNDFVIGAREVAPALIWYQRGADGWTRSVIEPDTLNIEAGGAFADIDSDGDLDIVMGGDYRSNEVWWWENPAPNFPTDGSGWTRRIIKQSGENQQHDQLFADLDGDGRLELAFWNQSAETLFVAEIPDDPYAEGEWPRTPIYAGLGEGLDVADIDQDGLGDLLAGGHWFKYTDGTYTTHIIDDQFSQGRVVAGDLIPGGLPEVVLGAGDSVGPLRWYACEGDPADPACWVGHDLLDGVIDHGHSLAIADFNEDGALDVFAAEMRLDGDNPDANMWIFQGDGAGNFTPRVLAQGIGNHESRAADLDGDGDIDILGKPYDWETPRVDVWLNPLRGGDPLTLDGWSRHVIDPDRPWRAVFITSGDLNGDSLPDVITGGWWYVNPGTPGGVWERRALGDPLNNMAAVADFDGDGDLDVLGTDGQETGRSFSWAENDGQGNFSVHAGIAQGIGDFLQGVAVGRFDSAPTEVILSWHRHDEGLQQLTVPIDPANTPWEFARVQDFSQDEQLSTADIDGDGDPDLLLGTVWLRNDGDYWTPLTLFETDGHPDRNRLADIDGDGRLDAVVGYEAISKPGTLAWYGQGEDPAALWTEHVISSEVVGPMSVDVADMDGDGDLDVIVGEHNLVAPESARLFVFENVDGQGETWQPHLVYTGDEHHDGAQVVDIDHDGDLDIVSIGWGHSRVELYENLAIQSGTDAPEVTPTATPVDRVGAGLQVLYTFDDGSGLTVSDRAGQYGLDLTIGDAGAVRWLADGGLAVDGNTLIEAGGDTRAAGGRLAGRQCADAGGLDAPGQRHPGRPGTHPEPIGGPQCAQLHAG